MDVYAIPEKWRKLLSEIQQHAPEAIIGGGCLYPFSYDVFGWEYRACQ